MEDNIEINEYVRTKKNGIQKIDHIRLNAPINRYCYFIGYDDDGDRCCGILKTTDIMKHSFNIIELLEAGDYVNGKEIILKDENENCVMYGFRNKDEQRIWSIYEEDIKSIVTKEQFASVEYKVGGLDE